MFVPESTTQTHILGLVGLGFRSYSVASIFGLGTQSIQFWNFKVNYYRHINYTWVWVKPCTTSKNNYQDKILML